MGTSVSMDETRTPDRETSPGWRELLENLYAQLEDARARELFLQRLLAEERRELQRLRGTGRPLPAAARPPGEPSPLHSQIMEALASQPAGLTHRAIQATLGTDRPLADVLRGLWRRGRLTRLGKGLYALPPIHNEASKTAKAKE